MTTATALPTGHPRGRGIAAAIALLVLVVGIPLVLGAVAPLRLPSAPTWDGVVDGLAGPDDGTLLRQVLGLAAWAAWACFTVSVVIEVLAVARRRPTPRIPLLATPQRTAAVLVAGVVGLLSARPGDAQAAAIELPQRPGMVQSWAPAVTSPHEAGAELETREDRHPPASPTVVVRQHDTLWALAERHLGSGLRYREIVALNRGREQPDGRRLTDPHWIYPGWVLRLPADATGAGLRHREPERTPPPTSAPDRTAPHRADPPPPAALEVDRGPRVAALTPAPREQAVPTLTAAAGLPGSAPGDRAPLVALGLGALTVAGVLAEVSRQRRGQQRKRRAGARIALPEGAAHSERLLRSVGAAAPARRLQDGLALLVDACRDRGQQVPRIALVRVSAARVELELQDEGRTPPPPFRAAGPSTWQWSGDERAPVDPDRQAPWPALVSVGTDGEDLVLVNLEAAGGLRVRSDPDQAEPVLAAMTTDLVSRSRAGAVTLTVADDLPGAAALAVTVGVETIAATAVGDRVRGHAAEVADVLRQDRASDVAVARGDEVAEEVWAPQIVVAGASDASTAPWSGSHVLAAGAGEGWALVPEDEQSWRLEPFDVRLRPTTLREPERADVAELLRPAPPPAPPPDAGLAGLVSTVLLALGQAEVPAAGSTGAGPEPGVPYVAVLGPVQVHGVDDSLVPGRVRRATELAAYLALHPGVGRYELDEMMWPGQRVARTTRNPFVSRTRQWLGRTPDGRAYLPLVADEGEYRLSPEVGCDWYDFVRASSAALRSDPLDVGGLVAALALVRGRPFQGVDPSSYGWADEDTQEIVSTVVDIAHVTAELLLAAGDAVGAARAAGDGLQVEPCSELLHGDAIRAAAARGDRAGIQRAVARMRASLAALGLEEDLLPETVELLERVGAT